MICIPCIYKLRRCSGNIFKQLEAVEYALDQIGNTTPAFTEQECADFNSDMERLEGYIEDFAAAIQTKLEEVPV